MPSSSCARPQRDAARRAARRARPDRHQGRLRAPATAAPAASPSTAGWSAPAWCSAPRPNGKSIDTIEGMAKGDELHPLQQKFLEHAALQCGICTPGFLVAAKALLEKQPEPDRDRGALLAGRQSLPLHRLRQDRARRARRRRRDERSLSHAREGQRAGLRVQVGRHAPDRPDGVDKVTGRAHFGADLVLPGQLVGKVLRSPHAARPHPRRSTPRRPRRCRASRRWSPRDDFPDQPSEFVPAGEMLINYRDVARNVMAREKALYEGHAGRRRRRDQRGDRQAGARS